MTDHYAAEGTSAKTDNVSLADASKTSATSRLMIAPLEIDAQQAGLSSVPTSTSVQFSRATRVPSPTMMRVPSPTMMRVPSPTMPRGATVPIEQSGIDTKQFSKATRVPSPTMRVPSPTGRVPSPAMPRGATTPLIAQPQTPLEQPDNHYLQLVVEDNDLAGGITVDVDINTEKESTNSYLSSVTQYLGSFWSSKKEEELKFEDTEHIPVVEMPTLPYEAMFSAAEHGVCKGASEVAEQVLLSKGWTQQASRSVAELGYIFSYAAVDFLHHYNKACAEGLDGDDLNATYQAVADTCSDMLVLVGTKIVFAGINKGIQYAAEYAQNASWIEPESAATLCNIGQQVSSKGAFFQNVITGNVQGAANIAATIITGAAVEESTKFVGNRMFLTPQAKAVEKSEQADLSGSFLGFKRG